MGTPTTTEAPRSSGRIFLFFGLALMLAGPAAYAVQLNQKSLVVPWYVLVASAAGVLLVATSLWRRRSVWRILALVLVLLVTGLEGAMLLMMRTPPYTGPVAAGKPFPAFTTLRADGTSFTQRDLEGDRDNVLVSFRGRW